jgi:hypothetical protein
MSGGFTLSGGEPLMQHRFTAKLLAAAKKMRIHHVSRPTVLGDRLSDADLENIDLVMLGIKSWGEDRHKDLTGSMRSRRSPSPPRPRSANHVDPLRAGSPPARTIPIAGGIAEFASGPG